MERERRSVQAANPGPGGESGSGENLEQIRNDMERLLSAGDELVNKALSGDSAAFVEASKQRGGE